MSTTNRSIAAGVFQDDSQAQQAMTDLQNAGFTNDQIRYSVHKGGNGILDSLMDLGLPQNEADFYNNEFLAGRTVVTVMTDDRVQEAYDILRRNGAYDANSRMGQGATYTQDQGATYAQGQTDQTAYDTNTNAGQRVQLREEQLTATKQQVQAGEVGIHKDVVTEEKTINVPVNREEVYIERTPVSGAVPSDTPIGQDETIRVPVSEEQVNVSKQPFVREELNIGKRVVQENQQVSDTVQREEARIDRSGDVNIQGNDVNVQDNPNQTYNQ
jgi:uncharacterized protein (TIGR02271 family)